MTGALPYLYYQELCVPPLAVNDRMMQIHDEPCLSESMLATTRDTSFLITMIACTEKSNKCNSVKLKKVKMHIRSTHHLQWHIKSNESHIK